MTLADWISALAGPHPTPAGGALSLVSVAGASALGAKIARALHKPGEDLEELAAGLLAAALEDAEAYRKASRNVGARRRCLEIQVRHLERSIAVLDRLGALFPDAPPELAADVTAGERIARAAARGLLLNLAVNLSAWAGEPKGLETFGEALSVFRDRLEGE